MKLSLIAACCLLIGCAHGVESETDSTPQTEVVTDIPAPKPAPPPQEESSPSIENDSNCIVKSYWVQNCLVVEIHCEGKLPQIEVACGPERRLFPWEYIPDPPPYDKQKKYDR